MQHQAPTAEIVQPKITIKGLKYAEFRSEETHCFEATIYVNGQRFCKGGNDGHGGPDWYHPIGKKQTQADIYARIKRLEFAMDDDDNFEGMVCEAVNLALSTKQVKQVSRRAIMYIDDDGAWEIKCIPAKQAARIALLLAAKPDAIVLNYMDPTDAAELLMKAGA